MVEANAVWPEGLLDAYCAMIPKVDGDSTPLGQRTLCVLPVVYRLWASLRLTHLKDWLQGWVPQSVFSLGNGVSSVEAWFSGAGSDQMDVKVADVIKSFDTVDRSILDYVLGRRGLPPWCRKVCLAYHDQVWLRFELAAGLGEPWCRDGGIPQGCPPGMVFIVALYVPWCRRLESVPSIRPQLYCDNLKCSSVCPNALFGAARFTVQFPKRSGRA